MHPFPYDPFQEQAIRCIREGISVFVSAPTGSGKTVIAEVAVEQALRAGAMAIYTAPIKALSNQKFREFHARYGDRVGILTGDLTLNPQASLPIMTTEIYRNTLFEGGTRFSRCRWVIFDEVHYLDDPERGTVWEEALLLTPRETEILALSATIPNARQLAAWIERIHGRPVRVVEETHRIVPLRYAFQCQDELFSDLAALKSRGYRGQERIAAHRRPFRMGRHRGGRYYFRGRSAGFAPPAEHHGRANRADHLLERIRQAKNLPCLYFTFSRRRVEDLALEFTKLGLLSEPQRTILLKRFDELCSRYEITHERSAADMRDLLAQGVAYHHAGLLPTLKEVVEVLFSSRLVPVIVTTETFALGVNMPARSVVLDTVTRRRDGPRSVLKVRELSQMAGRSGRRGMDEVGFVYLRINSWEVSFADLTRLLQGRPEEVSSRFNLTYATILNLWRRTGRDLVPFYQKTLHAFQAPRIHQREAVALIQRRLALLEKLGYLQPVRRTEPPSGTTYQTGPRYDVPTADQLPGRLTHKGEFAANLYGYELFLSELFEERVLDALKPQDLAILLLATVYEPRRGEAPPRVSRDVHDLAERTHQILQRIHREEKQHRIWPPTKGPAFHRWMAMERWLAGDSLDKVTQVIQADEGELIRYFRMTIQLCRALALSPVAGAGLKEKSLRLLERINRDQVDAEAELRRSL